MSSEQTWLARKYIVYKFSTNMFFLSAVWLYFYRIFITDQQVGLLDGMAFAIGLLAEIPSGALADKFGRDKMVRLGQALTGAGVLMQALGSSFVPFVVGQAVVMIGISFVSGADDALFFQRLNFDRDSQAWRKLVTRGSQAALAGSVIALVAGGWLHEINPRLPWIFTSIACFVSVILIWSVKDTRTRAKRQGFTTELKDYLQEIKTGFAQFRLPKLWIYVPLIVTLQGLYYTYGYGILRIILLDRFRFSPLLGSLAVALSSVITIALLSLMHTHSHRLSEKKVLSVVALTAIAGLLLSWPLIGRWGIMVIFVLYAGEHLLHPFMSEIINYHAPEQQRATVLSVASFLRTLPYVLLAPIIGFLNTRHSLEYFLLSWSLLVWLALLLYLSKKRADSKIPLAE